MRLTNFSDYALRLLLYAAAVNDRLFTIEEAAEAYGVSRHHLTKVAMILARAGFLSAVRGRNGGLALAKEPSKINLGAVLRITEPDFDVVECLAQDGHCHISRVCGLPAIANEATNAFLKTFDRYTLEDVLISKRQARSLFPELAKIS